MAITAVHFRFTWNMRDGVDFPTLEAAATLLLTFGGVVRAFLSLPHLSMIAVQLAYCLLVLKGIGDL